MEKKFKIRLNENEQDLLKRVIKALYPNSVDAEVETDAALKVIFSNGAERILHVMAGPGGRQREYRRKIFEP